MRYLLGDLSDAEQTRMEETFFADDSKFEAVELAEDELIDAYVHNELSPEDQRQFKAKIQTSPRLLERVNFANALAEKADYLLTREAEDFIQPLSVSSAGAKPKNRWWVGLFAQPPAWGMAMAACTILILGAGIVLVSGWLRLRSDSERLAAERIELQQQKSELDKLSREQRIRTDQLTAELQRERDQRAEDHKLIEELQRTNKTKESREPFLTTIATVFLTPGSLRSGGRQPELTIGPETTTTARVQLALEKNDYLTYNAAIKRADGSVVLRIIGLQPHNSGSGPQLLLPVPSKNLTAGDYIVHVDGVTESGEIEGVSDYAFRVTKK